MRVAVATHFYPPEPGAGALRVRSMVDAFAAAGHDVLGQLIQRCTERGEWSLAYDPGNDRQRFLTHRLVS